MATINWIKASLRGRLDEIVGSSWRGKPYVKTYTKPKNPDTPNQRAVRGVFSHLAAIAKSIYRPILKPYTFPTPQKMTAYNFMLHINKKIMSNKGWEPSQVQIFSGPLRNPGHMLSEQFYWATYNYDGKLAGFFGFVNNFYNNKDEYDADIASGKIVKQITVIYDQRHKVGIYNIAEGADLYMLDTVTVKSGQLADLYPVPTTEDIKNFHVYMAYVQLPNSEKGIEGIVSMTKHTIVQKLNATITHVETKTGNETEPI